MKIIFVRHGEPDDFDKDGQRLGNSGSTLTKRGRNEARRAGNTIKNIYNPKYLVSSTSPRAFQTAQLINEQIGKNFRIQEIGIDEEMAADILPIPPKMRQETIDKVICTLPQAYAEAIRTIKELQSQKFDGDVIHTTHSQRMTMIHWALMHDREPTDEEYLSFWKNYGKCLEQPQCQHQDTRFCKMFAVDFSAEKDWQVEYPYEIQNAKEKKEISKLTKLPNIGKELEKQLNAVDITNLEQLKRIGSKNAWLRIRANDPSACYMRLCALEGAIQGVRWHFLSYKTKADLKAFYNEAK